MSKDQDVQFDLKAGKIFYINYPSNEECHPCPFSQEQIDTFLELLNFKKGDTLLEPFMGTGRLAEEALKRGGDYYGFELEKKHFDFAQERLNHVE